MKHPHPWREIRALAHLLVFWRDDLGDGVHGLTDGENMWFATGRTQVQRRCAAAHELAHVRRGHGTCQTGTVERSIRSETARYLLPDIRAIGDAMAWATTADEAADALWVTPDVLADRILCLHPAERAYLTDRLADRVP